MTMPFLRLLRRKRFSLRFGGVFARAWRQWVERDARVGWGCRGFRDSQASDADAIGIGLVQRMGRFGTGLDRKEGFARFARFA